jgi:S1-C subfamily serine protease
MAGGSRRGALGALLAAAVVTGCGGGGSADVSRTQTTRVEVVKGFQRGHFDPQALYDRLSPGVVTIVSIFKGGGGSLLDSGGEGGQGSGFVTDGHGHIATNAHVVTSGRQPHARTADHVYVDFSDGNRVPAKVVGADPFADVALIKVDPSGLSLTPLTIGRSKDLKVGEPVAAIGSPFGENQSLSVGVISAVDRTIESLTQFQIGDAIQTDAAINPGNSGGPLIAADGKVVGINAQIRSRSGGGEGVGFAIPADAVSRSLRELSASGRVRYGYLGVTAEPLFPQLARALKLPVTQGALISQVQKGSPADDAGLRDGDHKRTFEGIPDVPVGGDVIAAVDGKKLTQQHDLADVIGAKREGDEVTLEIVRDGEKREVKLKLGRRPAAPPRN